MKKTLLSLLAISIIGLAGCEPEEDKKEQFVPEGTADMRGTWYDRGAKGGWYGPEKTWGFGWLYFEQYGTNIFGREDPELYLQNNAYEDLPELTGTIDGNRFHLTKRFYDLTSTINGTINRDSINLVETDPEFGSWGEHYERVNSNVVRMATPWNPGKKD